jgi:trimethylamine--corrinoid protein Co-methyltransferase
MQLGAGQLARFIDLPWRSAAGSASNTSDAQGAHENIMGLWGAVLAGANMVIHGAGWLEGGLTFGFEKLICDVEALQTMAELFNPTLADIEEQAYKAIKDVAPGGHFFSTQHTMARFDTEFYSPIVADLNNYGTWEANGSLTADKRATKIWQEILNNFEPPKKSEEFSGRAQDLLMDLKEKGGAKPVS